MDKHLLLHFLKRLKFKKNSQEHSHHKIYFSGNLEIHGFLLYQESTELQLFSLKFS